MAYLITAVVLALTGELGAFAVALLSSFFAPAWLLALCLTVLTLLAPTVFLVALAVVVGVAADAVADVVVDAVADPATGLATGVPLWANTGRVSAVNRAAAMREVDFMAIFLKEKFFSLGVLSRLFDLIAAPYFH